MEQIIFHVDVNSAFLSWEASYRLHHLGGTVDLRKLVSVVGGNIETRHGIILAKSIPAKQYNIRTGESIMEAKRKCPDLLVVPPNYKLYDRCSHAFMEILREYSPSVEQYSIDEAYMDMTGTQLLWGDSITVANAIRNRMSRELGFTVNIGISHNKLLAKMASDLKKPDQVHTLYPEEVPSKMWPLPVRDLFYVGRATFSKLYKLGIRTIGDLARTDVSILRQHLKSHGEVIWNYANGRDIAAVESTAPKNKGYGNSTTIAFDVTDAETAILVLLSLSEMIGMRIRKDNVKIEVVSVSIVYDDFQHVSHQKTLYAATNITNEIFHAAGDLFMELWDHKTPIRHLGIHTGRVREHIDFRQSSLFERLDRSDADQDFVPYYEKMEKADAMSDKIRGRYGIDALKRGVFIKSRQISHISGGVSREKHTVDYSRLKIE